MTKRVTSEIEEPNDDNESFSEKDFEIEEDDLDGDDEESEYSRKNEDDDMNAFHDSFFRREEIDLDAEDFEPRED